MKVTLEARQRLAEAVKQGRGVMSQRAYGRKLGVSGTTVQGWENLESFPETDNLLRIAENAGYTLQDFLAFLEGEPEQQPVSISQMTKQIKDMPIHQVAQIAYAVTERLASAVTDRRLTT